MIEYMQKLGEIFNTPELRNRYANGDIDLIEVKPIENPAIQVLTNKPRELAVVGESGSETIGEYIKTRIKTASSLTAELFVLSHKEIINSVIERWKEAQSGGRPFDAKILVSPDILDEFPYCQKAYLSLLEAGVPIRTFKTQEAINQRLHAKLAIFDNKDVIVGSANWSAVGLEQNVNLGQRNDYELTNKKIDEIIVSEHKEVVEAFERELGLRSVFDSEKGFVDYSLIKTRKQELKAALQRAEEEHDVKIMVPNGKEIDATEDNIVAVKRLLKRYKAIERLENSKEKYHRGNNECAIVFTSPKIAANFVKQFNKDRQYIDIK